MEKSPNFIKCHNCNSSILSENAFIHKLNCNPYPSLNEIQQDYITCNLCNSVVEERFFEDHKLAHQFEGDERNQASHSESKLNKPESFQIIEKSEVEKLKEEEELFQKKILGIQPEKKTSFTE